MVKLGVRRLDGVTGTAAAQAAQGEVVVQGEDLFGVVEAFDVLSGFGEVLCAVDMLEHVHISEI